MFRPASLILTAALTCAPAHAAPTAPEPIETAPAADRDAAGLLPTDRPRSADGGTGSRTIDLLIDLQQRSAGLQFNERQGATRSGEIKARVAPVTPAAPEAGLAKAPARAELPAAPPSGLFGSGATPMVQPARTATVEPRAAMGMDPPQQRRPSAASNGEPLPQWLTLPRELIEYVRENRWLVLGSVGSGLLLIWGISSLFARAATSAGRVPDASATRPDAAFSEGRWSPPRQEARQARRRSHRHRH